MNNDYSITTILVIAGFSAAYLWYLLRQIMKGNIELWDFISLSAVATLPVLFVAFPNVIAQLSHDFGIEIPFLLLYGILFAVAYYFLTRIAVLVHQQRKLLRKIAQDIALHGVRYHGKDNP